MREIQAFRYFWPVGAVADQKIDDAARLRAARGPEVICFASNAGVAGGGLRGLSRRCREKQQNNGRK
jgi:hypothetical protein